MYELSVLAMFKNESWIIREWIEHYILEGVEHFYLIDNGSTDDFKEKIKDYMDKISLVSDATRLSYGTQSFLYQKIFFDKIKEETKWIITCDIDEYIYARNGFKTITDALNSLPKNIETVWMPWKIFGSSNHIKHPSNIVNNFTKRSNTPDRFLGHGKSIFQTKNLVNFGCCGHYVEIKNNSQIHTPNGDNYYIYDFTKENHAAFNLHLNHYMFLSEEYYTNIKCNRGGGESGLITKYSIDYFRENNKKHNEIVDDELIIKKNNYMSIQSKYCNLPYIKIFNKYLSKAICYLQLSKENPEKLLFQTLNKKNLANIISIESNYDKFNEINNLMENNSRFIHLFNIKNHTNNYTNNYINNHTNNHINNNINSHINNNENSDISLTKIINKKILKTIDLIYIDIEINNDLYNELLKLISDKCYIIINKYNNKFKENFITIESINNSDLIVLQKKIFISSR